MEAPDEDNEHAHYLLQYAAEHELSKKDSPNPLELLEKKQTMLFEGINTKLTRLEHSLALI